MPNHVVNELIFRDIGNDRIAEILPSLINNHDDVDFSILIPLPLNMWWGSVGSPHEKAFKRTALDWCRDHWGTKWNAYNARRPVQTGGNLILQFDTAWRPPYPWLAAIFNKFEVSFEHNWLDEWAAWGWNGVFDFSKLDDICSDAWHEEKASDELQRHLHMLRWGCESFEDDGE